MSSATATPIKLRPAKIRAIGKMFDAICTAVEIPEKKKIAFARSANFASKRTLDKGRTGEQPNLALFEDSTADNFLH